MNDNDINYFEVVGNIESVFDVLFLNYNYYPFINKERTLKDIENCYFCDTSNPDFFIIEENNKDNKDKIFANSFFANCVTKFANHFHRIVEFYWEEFVNFKLLNKMSEAEGYDKIKYQTLLTQFVDGFFPKILNFVTVIDELDQISFTFLLKDDLNACNFKDKDIPNLKDYNRNSANWRKILRLLPKGNEPKSIKEILSWLEVLKSFIIQASQCLMTICDLIFSTLKIQTHFNFICDRFMHNFETSINTTILNKDIDKYISKTRIYNLLFEKNDQTNRLNDASFIDIDIASLLNKDAKDIQDKDRIFKIHQNLMSLIKYNIYSKQEFKDLLTNMVIKYKINEEDNKNDEHGYDLSNADDTLLAGFFTSSKSNNWIAQLYTSNDESKDERNSKSAKKEDHLSLWFLNNDNQEGFSYNDPAYIHNLDKTSEQFDFCYKLDLNDENTKQQLIVLNKYYTTLYKWRFLWIYYKLNLIECFNNEKCLSDKWKYHKNIKTNYDEYFNNKNLTIRR